MSTFVYAPTSWNPVTAPSGVGTFQSFGDSIKVWIKTATTTYIRFGTASSAGTLSSATAGYLTADVDYVLDVRRLGVSGMQVSAGSGATSTVYWADVS